MKLKFIPIFVGAISLITCLTGAIALSVTPNSPVAQESTSRPTPPPQQQFRQNLEQFHQRKPGNSPQGSQEFIQNKSFWVSHIHPDDNQHSVREHNF